MSEDGEIATFWKKFGWQVGSLAGQTCKSGLHQLTPLGEERQNVIRIRTNDDEKKLKKRTKNCSKQIKRYVQKMLLATQLLNTWKANKRKN